MKEIMLTLGKVALVDDADFEALSRFKWSADQFGEIFYARTKMSISGKSRWVRMHRFLLNPPSWAVVDHRDRNGLNNQRSNLRACTVKENNANRSARGVSKYKGVCRTQIRRLNKSGELKVYDYWQASIQVDNKSKVLGRFKQEDDAAKAYNEAALEKYGEFANLNEI